MYVHQKCKQIKEGQGTKYSEQVKLLDNDILVTQEQHIKHYNELLVSHHLHRHHHHY